MFKFLIAYLFSTKPKLEVKHKTAVVKLHLDIWTHNWPQKIPRALPTGCILSIDNVFSGPFNPVCSGRFEISENPIFLSGLSLKEKYRMEIDCGFLGFRVAEFRATEYFHELSGNLSRLDPVPAITAEGTRTRTFLVDPVKQFLFFLSCCSGAASLFFIYSLRSSIFLHQIW